LRFILNAPLALAILFGSGIKSKNLSTTADENSKMAQELEQWYKALSEEDTHLLNAYTGLCLRANAIPKGMTVGQAIKEQTKYEAELKKTMEEREAKIEAKCKEYVIVNQPGKLHEVPHRKKRTGA
jgi:uncharacterized FlgJ-related protein